MTIEQPFAMAEEKDCINYLNWLIANQIGYHFDENPEDIIWNTELEQEEIAILQTNHNTLWELCDPWKLLEDDSKLRVRYFRDN